MKLTALAALAFAIATPALAQTSPNGGIGSLTPPTPAPDQAQGPASAQPAPDTKPDDRNRPVQEPSKTRSQ